MKIVKLLLKGDFHKSTLLFLENSLIGIDEITFQMLSLHR